MQRRSWWQVCTLWSLDGALVPAVKKRHIHGSSHSHCRKAKLSVKGLRLPDLSLLPLLDRRQWGTSAIGRCASPLLRQLLLMLGLAPFGLSLFFPSLAAAGLNLLWCWSLSCAVMPPVEPCCPQPQGWSLKPQPDRTGCCVSTEANPADVIGRGPAGRGEWKLAQCADNQ